MLVIEGVSNAEATKSVSLQSYKYTAVKQETK